MFLTRCEVAKSQKRRFWRFARSQSLKNNVFDIIPIPLRGLPLQQGKSADRKNDCRLVPT